MPRVGRNGDVEARLALAETLLLQDTERSCAEYVIGWLAEHAGIRLALCAALDNAGDSIVGIAARGIPTATVDRFVLALEDRHHPLVRALVEQQPAAFTPDGAAIPLGIPAPLSRRAVLAIPLIGSAPASRGSGPVGLLLVRSPTARPSAALRWSARLLGHRLAQIRGSRGLADSERRLARERVLLQTILNAVPDPVLMTDADGRLIIANARAESLLTANEGQSEGRQRAVAINNMLFSSALSHRAIEGAKPSDTARKEILLVDPSDGSDLLFEMISTAAADRTDGGIVSILRNVTDLRRATDEIEANYRRLRIAESEIRAERDRLDLIIDSVADPILVTDPAGAIVLMNSPAERLFTARPGQQGTETQRIVRANDAHFSSFVSNLFFSGEGLRWNGEISLTDPTTGRAMPVEAISGKILSEQGEVTGVVTILHDRTEAIEKALLFEQVKRASVELAEKVHEATTELVRQNELLRRQAIELEQASSLKSQFLANVSHEFRTPLNAILGYTSMMIQGVQGALSPQQQRALARVDSNARHLLSIINDILDISRIEAGRMPLHLGELELRELLAEVLAEVEPIIQKTQLAVTSEIPDELPLLKSDRQKLKQIVLNLLTNALKFTPRGWVRVTTTYDPDTALVSIAVADSGIGISEEDQARVFEDFRQADNSPTREYGGTGLGLAICRRLATMLGGKITLTSRLGEGSTFTLEIPCRPKRK